MGDEAGEIGFRGVVVAVPVVAEPPVELDGVVFLGVACEDGQGFEEGGRFLVLAVVEIIHGRRILGVCIVAGEEGVILRLAGRHSYHGQDYK